MCGTVEYLMNWLDFDNTWFLTPWRTWEVRERVRDAFPKECLDKPDKEEGGSC